MKTSDECLAKMEALVRRMASDECGGSTHARKEARAIVAELDKQSVGNAEIEAGRKLLLAMYSWFGENRKDIPRNIKAGVWDDSKPMKDILKAIAKGCELERSKWLSLIEKTGHKP